MRKLSRRKQDEILSLQRRGLTTPKDLVDFAKNPKTALHSEFPWDDRVAARAHRLEIARHLIRAVVMIIPNVSKPVRAFVSLKRDRKKENGGYRQTITVMSNADLRDELLEQALQEFNYWRDKYKMLQELIPVFVAAERVKSRKRRRKSA